MTSSPLGALPPDAVVQRCSVPLYTGTFALSDRISLSGTRQACPQVLQAAAYVLPRLDGEVENLD